MPLIPKTTSARLAALFALFVLVLSVSVDLVPRFYLGDSVSYLSTQIGGYIPDDRSWLYGIVAVFFLKLTRAFISVEVIQIAGLWLSAVLLGLVLRSYFRLGWWFFAVTLVVLSWEPLSFFWARAFMSDASGAILWNLIAATLFYESRLRYRLAIIFTLAFLLCALRSVYLPPLSLAFGLVTVLLLWHAIRSRKKDDAGDQRGRVAMMRHGALLGVLVFATFCYAVVNAAVSHKPQISVNYANTRFLVSAWSPAMEAGLKKLDIPADTKARIIPLTHDARLAHAFAGDGIDEVLHNYYGSYEAAEPAYKFLLKEALLRSPGQLLGVILQSWSDYLDPSLVLLYHRENRFTGATGYKAPNSLPPDLLDKIRGWGVHGTIYPEMPQAESFSLHYLARIGGYWALLVAFHATLGWLIYFFLPRRNRSYEILAVQLFGFAYFAMVAITSNELVTRYLIPLDVPLLLTIGCLCGRRSFGGDFRRTVLS